MSALTNSRLALFFPMRNLCQARTTYTTNSVIKRSIYPIEERRLQLDKVAKKENIYTIPNALSLVRLTTTPAIGYFILNGMNNHAMCYFAASALTDLLDGLIARKFPSQATRIGAIMDPLADKALIMTSFFTLAYIDLIPIWLAKCVIVRDVILLSFGGFIRYFGFKERPTLKDYFDFGRYPTENLHPTRLSKFNTILQCSVVVATLCSTIITDPAPWAIPLIALQVTTATTTFLSFMQYVQRANRDSITVKIK